jgi:hypothetical protein
MRGLFVLLVATACAPNVVGNGQVETQQRLVNSFSGVHTWGALSSVITAGSETAVSVTTDANLQRFVSTEVEGGVLMAGGDFVTPLEPTAMDLTAGLGLMVSLRLDGWGNTVVSGIRSSEFLVDWRGSGVAQVSGAVDNLTVEVAGDGVLDLSRLVARTIVLDVQGGEAEIWVSATESITGSHNGAGPVYLLGSGERSVLQLARGLVIE